MLTRCLPSSTESCSLGQLEHPWGGTQNVGDFGGTHVPALLPAIGACQSRGCFTRAVEAWPIITGGMGALMQYELGRYIRSGLFRSPVLFFQVTYRRSALVCRWTLMALQIFMSFWKVQFTFIWLVKLFPGTQIGERKYFHGLISKWHRHQPLHD